MLKLTLVPLLLGCPQEAPPAPTEDPIPERPASPLADQPFDALPGDGLAEVAHYRYEREHYGVMMEGRATLLVVRESLDPQTLLKTRQADGIPAIKLMILETLPSMNWDIRENLAMFSTPDLQPLKLAITAEEWCGNNFLEWRQDGGRVSLIGRPYTDDTDIRTETIAFGTGHHLYEQLPLIVRGVGEEPLQIRLVAPQTAYLPPHTEEVTVTLARAGTETLRTEAGTFETVRIDVTPQTEGPMFPGSESYWIDADGGFLVKATRHEYDAEFGEPNITPATLTLLSHERSAYWSTAVGPVTSSLEDRRRATLSAQRQLNLRKATADRKGDMFSIDDLPPEYLSDPAGNSSFSGTRDGSGGWTLDDDDRFVPNVP